MEPQINYNALNELINQQKWWFSASECYGILTGLICFKQAEQWPVILFKDTAIEPQFNIMIERIVKHIEDDLQSNSLKYQLLLPEEVALSERAEALVYWAEGFIIASAHVKQMQDITLDSECNEFLDDLQEIILLDTHLPDTEQNSQLLTDLEEHCRMGALLIYASVHSTKTKP